MEQFWRKYKMSIFLFLGVFLGILIGILFQEDAVLLKPFGDIFLNLMFTIVVPLVFFTISSSISSMLDLRRLGTIFKVMILVFLGTSFLAAFFMLLSVKLVNPVSGNILVEAGETVESISIGERIVSAITVSDFSDILSRSHMLPLILFSILFGVGVSLLKEEGKEFSHFLTCGSKIMMKVVHLIMYYAPIGLCGYFASFVGEFGTYYVESYARSFFLYLIVGLLYYFLFYPFYVYLAGGKEGVRRFWKSILPPTFTALATQSSLATLPTNLEAAENMGIPKDIREVCLPIGTTMNMHGSVLGSILKIAFLFSVFGRSFQGIDTYLLALLIAVLSGVVMSGIPGGGLIGEMLIVSLYNFPAGAFALIATIGLLIDAPATALNVVGNPCASMLITRIIEGKHTFQKKD